MTEAMNQNEMDSALDKGRAPAADTSIPDFPPGMTKKITREGEGDERPVDGCEVSVHYVGTLEDGKQFDSSRERDSPFTFTLGTGSVIKGWEIGVKTMRRNEVADFSLPPELAYGESGSPGAIPPNARLNFNIELLDWVEDEHYEKPVYKMDMEERLAKSQEKKDAGGVQFKEGKYNQAIKQYREIMKLAAVSDLQDDGKVVELLSEDNPNSKPETDREKNLREQLKEMKLLGHLNLALCYLKLEKVKESLTECDSALAIDPKNTKAHFRKGLGYLATNDTEMALKQFDKVLEIDPKNAEAKAKKAHCASLLKEYYAKQKSIYKNMFSK